MKSCLIIGANGFIGSRLCRKLSNQGVEVHATSRHSAPIDGASSQSVLDITDKKAVDSLLQSCPADTLYFLAAVTEHHRLIHDPVGCLEAYASAAINLVNGVKNSRVSRVVYSSTGKVYGNNQGAPIAENHLVDPSNVLGRIKAISEGILEFAFKSFADRELVLARIFNVYGPGQKDSFVVPTIINQLKVSPQVDLGNLNDGRDYIYIEDLISALGVLGSAKMASPISSVNIGSGTARSVRDIINTLEIITGSSININQRSEKLRHDEHSSECSDTAKLRGLGWNDQITFEEGLRQTIRSIAPELER